MDKTERARLESVARQTGKVPKELEDLEELPESMRYIWKYFLDLNRKRQSNGYSALPLQYSEILAYFSLYHIQYDTIELHILSVLDNVAMDYFAEQAEKEVDKSKRRSKK